MVSESELSSAAFFSITLFLLYTAVVMAVYAGRCRQPFWVGFAAGGGVYVILLRGFASDNFRSDTCEYH